MPGTLCGRKGLLGWLKCICALRRQGCQVIAKGKCQILIWFVFCGSSSYSFLLLADTVVDQEGAVLLEILQPQSDMGSVCPSMQSVPRVCLAVSAGFVISDTTGRPSCETRHSVRVEGMSAQPWPVVRHRVLIDRVPRSTLCLSCWWLNGAFAFGSVPVAGKDASHFLWENEASYPNMIQ